MRVRGQDGLTRRRDARPGKKAQYLAVALSRAVSLTEAQLRLIREWDATPPTPDDGVGRRIWRDRRAGAVSGALTALMILLLLGLFFLIWLHFASDGLLP